MPSRSKRAMAELMLLLLTALWSSRAGAAELGDCAPPIEIAAWLQGDPVQFGEPSHLYVLETWGTWCPACLRELPAMADLAARFKSRGVTFVGLTSDSAEEVAAFLAAHGRELTYPVAQDHDGKTIDAFNEAYGVTGIPHVFVLDDANRVVWHGHPAEGLAGALDRLLEGTYSYQEIAAGRRARRLLPIYFAVAEGTDDRELLHQIGQRLLTQGGADPELLNAFAWKILTAPELKLRDPELAMQAIQRALALTQSRDASVLDTYARALQDRGDLEHAIEWQKKAVALSKHAEERAEFEARLMVYERMARRGRGGGTKGM